MLRKITVLLIAFMSLGISEAAFADDDNFRDALYDSELVHDPVEEDTEESSSEIEKALTDMATMDYRSDCYSVLICRPKCKRVYICR